MQVEVVDPPRRPRTRAEAMARNAYTSASHVNSNIALWRPPARSVDADTLKDAPTIRARARDLERNHPFAKQAIRASALGVVGKRLRYSCRPDHRFLGIDFEEAVRWGQEWERIWESYAHGLGKFSHAARTLSFTQQMRQAHKRRFVDGESLVAFEWARGRRWQTCAHGIDVDRLSNPQGAPETAFRRAGVELSPLGEPIAYHIRNAHPSDGVLHDALRTATWSRVPRETAWGRTIVALSFDAERPSQTRGVSMMASVITDMKMGREYQENALAQMALQSSYAAVLTSQQNYKDALEAIGGMDPTKAKGVADLALENLEAALAYHQEAQIRFNGASIPVLWPGEDLKLITPGNGAAPLEQFQGLSTKAYAAGTGTDPISVSQDYSNVNYSSAKMAIAANWRQYEVLRQDLIDDIAMPWVANVLEEAVFSGAMKLPKGVSPLDFYAALPPLVRGTFLTLGAPNLEPVKEAEATGLEMKNGTTTLQDACAEKGVDYLEQLDQLHRENLDRAARGLPPLDPAMVMPGMPAPPAAPAKDDGGEKDG